MSAVLSASGNAGTAPWNRQLYTSKRPQHGQVMPALKKYPGELCFVLGKASILRYRPSSVETTKGAEMRMGSHTSYKTTTLASGGGRVDLLPHAMGLDAFWHGRPIWANPFAGEPAREWANGWHSGLAELQRRCRDEALPAADGSAEWKQLVQANRH